MTTNTSRIMKEIKEVSTDPEKYFKIYVSEENIMDWYIMYYNIDDPRFKDGQYILHIKLPEGYPFQAPDFRWLTPNGRFEVNKVIGNEPAYHKDNSFKIIPFALQEYFSKDIADRTPYMI